MYKNIQSKVYNQPKIKNDIPHPINNSKRINKYNEQKGEKPNKIVRPNSASAKTLSIQYGNQNAQKTSMFEEYYKNKMNINNMIIKHYHIFMIISIFRIILHITNIHIISF